MCNGLLLTCLSMDKKEFTSGNYIKLHQFNELNKHTAIAAEKNSSRCGSPNHVQNAKQRTSNH